MEILVVVVVLAFVAGFAVASRWIKNNVVAQILVSLALGAGFIVVLCGIFFAGCLIIAGMH